MFLFLARETHNTNEEFEKSVAEAYYNNYNLICLLSNIKYYFKKQHFWKCLTDLDDLLFIHVPRTEGFLIPSFHYCSFAACHCIVEDISESQNLWTYQSRATLAVKWGLLSLCWVNLWHTGQTKSVWCVSFLPCCSMLNSFLTRILSTTQSVNSSTSAGWVPEKLTGAPWFSS